MAVPGADALSPHVRRVIYVVTYEVVAISIVTGALVVLGHHVGGASAAAVSSSAVALGWNFVWTTIFEAWEQRQASTVRTVPRRIAHAVGYEIGLLFLLIPVGAWILQITLWEAFLLNAGFLVFFLCYTFSFVWLFDIILPPRRTQVS